MNSFMVVLSDIPHPGAPLGDQLVSFLNTYREGDIRAVTLQELLTGPLHEVDTLFVALPTSFSKTHAERIRWRNLVLFDCFDEPQPEWRYSDEIFLRSLTDRYLKTHVVDGQDFGFKMGTLPVPFNARVCDEYERFHSRKPLRNFFKRVGREERPWDVTLLGSVTFLLEESADKSVRRYHQRVDWSREIRARKEWRFWGGLRELPYCRVADLEPDCGSVTDLMWQGPGLPFREFFRRMTRTKVSLAPTGHARWTYRHLESVYAGCHVISNDLSGIRTFIPLPTHCFEMVPDHAPLAPTVERVLSQWGQLAAQREYALDHFEQYLYHGRYDARRPVLMERFLAQVKC